MKVLYLLHSIDHGGATISFMNMVEGLIHNGIEPVIVHPNGTNPIFFEFLKRNKIRSYCIKINMCAYTPFKGLKKITVTPRYRFKLYIEFYKEKRALSNIVDIEKPNIIHTNTGVVQSGYFVAKKKKIPHVWHLREYQDKDFGWSIFPSKKKLEKYLHDSYVISITKDIINHFNLQDSSKATYIYNGCLSNKCATFTWPKEKFFICANQIIPAKCMEDTIIAFSKFYSKNPDYKLIICGTGSNDYIKELKQLALEHGVSKSIDWLGFVENTPEIMKKSIALIVSSRSEGFGRMSAEASIVGCLVTGRNTGGTKEILEKTGGFLFDTIDELAQQLGNLSKLTFLDYKAYATKAQNVALGLYTNEAHVKGVYDFYNSIQI